MSPRDTPGPAFYTSQRIQPGYGYLKTRDGTAPLDQRHPAGPGRRRAVPHRGGVLGLRPVEPRGAPTGVGRRPDPGLRHRRRQPARHRLLRWRVGLLRDAAVARRLRRHRGHRRAAVGREREGGHGRDLVPRHHPALRGPDPTAAPGRDHAAVRARRHLRHPLPRRYPERRLRVQLGQGSLGRRTAGRRGWTALGTAADQGRRHDVREEPGVAAPGSWRAHRDQGQPLQARRSIERARPRHVRRQDRRARLHRRLVAGPGDRQPFRRDARRLLARRAGEGDGDERHPRRRARACRALAVDRVPRLLRGPQDPFALPRDPRDRVGDPHESVRPGRLARARPLHRPTRLPDRAGRVRVGTRGARAVRRGGRRPAGRAGPRVLDDGDVVAPARHGGHHLLPGPPRHPDRHATHGRARNRHLRLRPVGVPEDGRRAGGQPAQRPLAPLPLEAGARRQGIGLRERAARRRHRDGRHGQRRPLAAVDQARRRPRGDDQRGSARRAGDVRGERLVACESTRPRPQGIERAPAGADPHQGRRCPAAAGKGNAGAGPALSVRPRVPGRIEDPDRRATARRQPARVGVRRADLPRHRHQHGRPFDREPSKVVLPLVPGVSVPTLLPACGSLRGQPCRSYVPLDNTAKGAP